MTDTFARQHARTQRFALGTPHSFQISPDGKRIVFLRSKGGADPVTCLWVYDVAARRERIAADPASLAGGLAETLDPQEKARRERARESASGIVSYATDEAMTIASFVLSGSVYVADLTGGAADGVADGPAAGLAAVGTLPADPAAADPRPDPTGRFIGYVLGGALRVRDLTSGEDRVLADPAGAAGVTFGLAEFIAAEEMGRHRGYWWAPDGGAILTARVDDSPVQRWHIADPANPDRPAANVGYPAAGTPNAEVSLLLARLDGTVTPVDWDRAAFPYLVTACWQRSPGGRPLIVVQSRDQRQLRLLEADPDTGSTVVIRADADPYWLDIVPGVPARTASGQIVWTTDAGGARRLLVAAPGSSQSGPRSRSRPTTCTFSRC